MTSRREFLQIAAAAAAIIPGGWTRAFAQQRLTQADLLARNQAATASPRPIRVPPPGVANRPTASPEHRRTLPMEWIPQGLKLAAALLALSVGTPAS